MKDSLSFSTEMRRKRIHVAKSLERIGDKNNLNPWKVLVVSICMII